MGNTTARWLRNSSLKKQKQFKDIKSKEAQMHKVARTSHSIQLERIGPNRISPQLLQVPTGFQSNLSRPPLPNLPSVGLSTPLSQPPTYLTRQPSLTPSALIFPPALPTFPSSPLSTDLPRALYTTKDVITWGDNRGKRGVELNKDYQHMGNKKGCLLSTNLFYFLKKKKNVNRMTRGNESVFYVFAPSNSPLYFTYSKPNKNNKIKTGDFCRP